MKTGAATAAITEPPQTKTTAFAETTDKLAVPDNAINVPPATGTAPGEIASVEETPDELPMPFSAAL